MSGTSVPEGLYQAAFQGGTKQLTVDLVTQYRRQHHADTAAADKPSAHQMHEMACDATTRQNSGHDQKHGTLQDLPVQVPVEPAAEHSLALTSVQGEAIMYDIEDGASDSHTLQPSLSLASMMSRTFNENDPFQVYDESLLVLGEVEDLIRAELSMAPAEPLGSQTELELAKLPASLLAALQETIEVVLVSRSEIDEIMSCASSDRSYQSRRSRMQQGSPYWQGQSRRTTQQSAAASWHSSHISISSAHKNYHIRPNKLVPTARHQPSSGQVPCSELHRTYAPGSKQHQSSPSCAASQLKRHNHASRPQSAATSPVRLVSRAAGSPQLENESRHKMQTLSEPDLYLDSLIEPSTGISSAAAGVESTRPASSRRDGGQLVSAVLKAAAGASSDSLPHGSMDPLLGSTYLHQRMQAKRLEEEEAATDAALGPQHVKRGLDNVPYPEFIAKQQLRQAEAERKRIAQMRADLQFIEQLREKRAAAEVSHEQTLQQAQASVAALQTHKQHTHLTQKWIQYQHSLAAIQP